MANKTDQTASFVLRFTQNIFESEEGQSDVQWRGKVTHVQGDDQLHFSELQDALEFIQKKLSNLTLDTVKDRSTEEKEGILSKSLDFWKKTAREYPKLVMNAIKDPKAQVAQIQEQISQVGDELSSKIEFEKWQVATKSDLNKIVEMMEKLSSRMDDLSNKIDSGQKKK